MKHPRIAWLAVLLIAAILTGCGTPDPTVPQTDAPPSTAAPTETQPEVTVPETTVQTLPTDPEDITVSEYVDPAYAEQIGRYYTALSQRWDESKYLDNGLSTLPYYYYDNDPLANVGFGYQDLDNDGSPELIIGAIANAELDPVVFEIWTLVDGEPVMLVQSGYKNIYYLQYSQEDFAWSVAYQATVSAASSGSYYLMLMDGKLEVMQGIVFDAQADEENPWFMSYDLDWDVSNDEPIDADMADAILENNRRTYTAFAYIPYTLYK